MPNVPDNNRVNIGGVSFNKDHVWSSEKVIENGKEINSVFLKDATEIRFPNQPKSNEAYVDSKMAEKVEYESRSVSYTLNNRPVARRGTDWYYTDFNEKVPKGDEWLITTKRGKSETKTYEIGHDKTDFYRLNGATIIGSADSDDYTLRGCRNTTVDVSRDGKADEVSIIDDVDSKHKHSSGKNFKSGNNKVKQDDSDTTYTVNRNPKWYQSSTKANRGEGTVKE